MSCRDGPVDEPGRATGDGAAQSPGAARAPAVGVLSIRRSSFSDTSRGEARGDPGADMRRIDAWFLKYPFYSTAPGSRRPTSGSRWTVVAGAGTTSSSSGCGVRSHTRLSLSARARRGLRSPHASSANGSASTPPSGCTRRSAGERRPRSTAATRLWICWTRRSAPVPTDSNTPARRPRPQEPGGI